MYCKNCGSWLDEGAKFCKKCGARVTQGNQNVENMHQEMYKKPKPEKTLPKKQRKPHNKKSKAGAVAIGVLTALLLVGIGSAGVYATVGLNSQRDKITSRIDKSDIPDYVQKKDDAVDSWKGLKITDIADKKELLKDLKSIEKDVEEYNTNVKNYEAMQDEKEKYHLDEAAYAAYEEALNACETAVKEKDTEQVLTLIGEAKDAKEALVDANDSYVKSRVDMYEKLDLSEAEEKEVSGYEENLKKIKALDKKEDTDYTAYKDAFAKMDEAVYMYIEPETALDVSIQQVDASEFPKVKLYMSLRDPATGEVPADLDDAMFYIRKEDANAKFVKQTVTAVNQLNEKEALTVDMVADVSGSMNGEPLREAKEIMSNFVSSVQFDAGDMVELTSFSTGVRLEQEFCNDQALLIRDINALTTDDMTSLYDALYTSVERVAARTGARCVIAFTDGNDNYSSCTKEQVVEVAKRYRIPIFIIGIGSIDSGDISYIASNTGGKYYDVDDVESMGGIYDEIYRMEKELYLLEFEDTTGMKVSDTANIQAGYKSVAYGGECDYSYKPNVLLSAKSENIYKDGPEAVVETYLKNFPKAVTNSDFSLISGCLKSGSAIYTEQQKYVQNDIKEQLDSYEITAVDYSDNNNCVVSTRETYYVQVKGKALQLMTQACKYALVKDGNDWKMTAFVDLKVVSRIKQ